MEGCVSLFISSREDFFREKTCINCPVDKYIACDNVSLIFDIDGVLRKEVVDVGHGVRMSEPLKVDKGLMGGTCIFASLSHQGVFAIHISGDMLQFTDLNANRHVKMEVEKDTLVGYYDNMVLLLTWGMPLRETTVESVFDKPSVETFKKIEGTSDVDPITDVSLLNDRRELYYTTTNHKLFSFNVDTRTTTEINLGRNISHIISLSGIDCEMKIIFKDFDDKCTHTLSMDDTMTRIDNKRDYWPWTVFPSASDPKNISDAVFMYGRNLRRRERKIHITNLVELGGYYSLIRVYRDIFLAYDENTESWCLIRLVVS